MQDINKELNEIWLKGIEEEIELEAELHKIWLNKIETEKYGISIPTLS